VNGADPHARLDTAAFVELEVAADRGDITSAVRLAELLLERAHDGDFERASALAALAYEAGEPTALRSLANAYRNRGNGGDFERAIDLMQPLADQGDEDAQFDLALVHLTRNEADDFDRAVLLLTALAGNGDAVSMVVLGEELTARSKSGSPERQTALEWIERAIELGEERAPVAWGRATSWADPIEETHYWVDLAQQGSAEAAIEVARLLEMIEYEDPPEWTREVIGWLRVAAADGDLEAVVELARALDRRRHDGDRDEAFEWWTWASDRGDLEGMWNLARHCADRGDFERAADLATTAAGAGYRIMSLGTVALDWSDPVATRRVEDWLRARGADDTQALRSLAIGYITRNEPGDRERAHELWSSAVEQGDDEAAVEWGMDLVSTKTRADLDQAIELFLMAAEADNVLAKNELGKAYKKRGEPGDDERSREWRNAARRHFRKLGWA